MAIKKKKANKVGIVTDYHRIVSINNIIGEVTVIEVASYIDKEKRSKEKENRKAKKQTDVYIETEYVEAPAEANILTAEDAYNYLMTLETYADAVSDKKVDEVLEKLEKEE